MRGRGINAVAVFLVFLAFIASAIAQDLPTLLSRFQSERDRSTKEMILDSITKDYPASGSALLRIANQTEDTGTRWLAIRGMGYLKFTDAAPFLKQSLDSESSYVRANAARALGKIHESSAAPNLIRILKTEQDSGVIEQTALALEMLEAKAAVPALKDRVGDLSPQTRM
jgi:HEAT repeat protein